MPTAKMHGQHPVERVAQGLERGTAAGTARAAAFPSRSISRRILPGTWSESTVSIPWALNLFMACDPPGPNWNAPWSPWSFFVGQQVEAGEECRPDGEHHRHRPEELLHVGDDRFIAQGGVEADLVERDAGQVEPAGAPQLLSRRRCGRRSGPGFSLMRSWAILISSLRCPKVSASWGQISTQAGGLPFLSRVS